MKIEKNTNKHKNDLLILKRNFKFTTSNKHRFFKAVLCHAKM